MVPSRWNGLSWIRTSEPLEPGRGFGCTSLFAGTCSVARKLTGVIQACANSDAGDLDSPFIRAARGHGISRHRILFRHALPVAINPIVSLFGFSLASLLSISLLTEVIMSWPGLGPLLLEAVLARDIYLVIGATMFSTLFLVMGTAMADILLYASDSRIHLQGLK